MGWTLSPERTPRAACPWGRGGRSRVARILGEEWRQGLLSPDQHAGCPCFCVQRGAPSPSAVPGGAQPRYSGGSPPREESSSLLAEGVGWECVHFSGEGLDLGLSLQAFTWPSVFPYPPAPDHLRCLVRGIPRFQALQHDSGGFRFPILLSLRPLAHVPSVFQNVKNVSCCHHFSVFPCQFMPLFVLLLSLLFFCCSFYVTFCPFIVLFVFY